MCSRAERMSRVSRGLLCADWLEAPMTQNDAGCWSEEALRGRYESNGEAAQGSSSSCCSGSHLVTNEMSQSLHHWTCPRSNPMDFIKEDCDETDK